MVKKIQSKAKVKKTEVFTIGEAIQCDMCMKTIWDSRDNKMSDEYYTVTMGNRDYPESYDDNEYLDLCSKSCLYKALEKYFEYQKEWNSTHFEIENSRRGCYVRYEKPDYVSDEKWDKILREAK